MKKKQLLTYLLSAAVFFSCTPSGTYQIAETKSKTLDAKIIRVLILKTDSEFFISSEGKLAVTNLRSMKKIMDSDHRKIVMNHQNINDPLLVESWSLPIDINGIKYRGAVEIHNIFGVAYVINIVRMDNYLSSVVPGEIPPKWGSDALKAQAVAARTYAYYHLLQNKAKKLYDLDSTTSFQVYKGVISENPATSKAVSETSGEIIVFEKKPILSYYHSTCGGRTSDDKFIWKGSDHHYLRGISCNFCKESPHYSWETSLTLSQIRDSLKKSAKFSGRINSIAFKKNQGRITEVIIRHAGGVYTLTGNEFRLLFQKDEVKSTFFNSKKTRTGLHLKGKGWGHGAGMCQWGAKGMAEKGYNYKKILHFYYRGIVIEKVREFTLAAYSQ